MEKYVPDIYQKSIYAINYDSLLSRGIKCLLFDLDNTIAPVTEKGPSDKVKELFDDLKEKGFKIIIFSNSARIRVRPFKDELEVDCCASARKPRPDKFLSVIKIYGYNFSEVAIIGDSIMDDIVGGNGVGITTILINPIGKKEFPFAKIRRWKENKIVKKLRDNDLFTKGRYYE
jgi:HAD superfamily (subfamily IIIA) phosphatase, TIGR01668